MRRLVAALVLLSTPAWAAPAGEAAKPGVPGTNVEMPFLMAPLSDADGKLEGYAYIASRLTAASAADALQVRNKLAFIQDAFVRDVNGANVRNPDGNGVDIPKVEARLLADARRIMGRARVNLVTICTVQIAALRAQTPSASGPADADPAASKALKSRCDT